MAALEQIQPERNPILNAAAMERALNYGQVSAVEEGTVVVHQGEPMERFLIVIDGEITVEQSHRGGTEFVNTHVAGQFFGDVHSLSGRPSLVTNVAPRMCGLR